MLFAQESTAESNHFNDPMIHKIEPGRTKAKKRSKGTAVHQRAIHQQGPLFAEPADMLHEPDEEQRERAHHVCGSTTVYNAKGGLRLYCGRRDCPYCFKRRYRRIGLRIRRYKEEKKEKLYSYRILEYEHSQEVRAIKKENGEYICFPIVNKHGTHQEILVTNLRKEDSALHTDFPRLESHLAVWTRTPQGRKISFSKGFRQEIVDTGDKVPNYFVRLALPKVVPYAEAAGAKIEKVSKSYVKWKVDPEKLTDKLLEEEIVAYQITMVKTLFQDKRDAEDAMATETQTDEEAAKDFGAVPLNKKGRPVALPIKLHQLLRESSGTVLHNNSSLSLPMSDSIEKTTSPPPS